MRSSQLLNRKIPINIPFVCVLVWKAQPEDRRLPQSFQKWKPPNAGYQNGKKKPPFTDTLDNENKLSQEKSGLTEIKKSKSSGDTAQIVMACRSSPACCSLAHTIFLEQFLKQVGSPASPRLGLWGSKLEQCKPELWECSRLLHHPLYLAV